MGTDNSETLSASVSLYDIGSIKIAQMRKAEGNDSVLAKVTFPNGDTQTLQIGANTINCTGSAVRVELRAEVKATLMEVHGNMYVEHLTNSLSLSSVFGDVTINAMHGELHFDTIEGDCNIREMNGTITGQSVNGNVRLDSIQGSVTILKSVEGDVAGRKIGGLRIHTVNGEVNIIDIQDSVIFSQIDGDFRAVRSLGSIEISGVLGSAKIYDTTDSIWLRCNRDVYFQSILQEGKEYAITGENITFRVVGAVNAQFVASSDLGSVHTNLPLLVDKHRRYLVGILGQAKSKVTLKSKIGQIMLDSVSEDTEDETGKQRRRKRGLHINIDGPYGIPDIQIETPDLEDLEQFRDIGKTFSAFFRGEPTMSTQPTNDDDAKFEQRMRDLSERSSRAMRKAAEKAREYGEKAAQKARETDWEAVGREVRSAIEKTVSEIDSAFKEIIKEFQNEPAKTSETDSDSAAKKTYDSSVKHIPIEKDDPADVSAQSTIKIDDTAAASLEVRRRAILEQLKDGAISIEEAQKQLGALQ